MKEYLMKLGLKLWSINTDYYLDEAKRLYQEGWFDYIELYVVPKTSAKTSEHISKWKKSEIPFTLHAPHFVHKVNLASKEKESYNREIFEEVEFFRKELNAQYVVMHGGMYGSIEETIRQLKGLCAIIPDFKNAYLIENKPLIAPLDKALECRGAKFEEIQKVINEIGCGFCLDVGHAICTANSLKLEPYSYVKRFNDAFNPICYHLSDNFINSEIDGHMHLGKGNYDFKKIFEIIYKDRNIAIETNKASKIALDDFVEDVKWLKNLL